MPYKNKSHYDRQPKAKKPPEKRRLDARRYDRRWSKLSKFVRQQEPMCRMCKKALAQCVDHIVPLENGGEKYDLENLQPLCNSCHSRKTAAEDGGFGNKKG